MYIYESVLLFHAFHGSAVVGEHILCQTKRGFIKPQNHIMRIIAAFLHNDSVILHRILDSTDVFTQFFHQCRSE